MFLVDRSFRATNEAVHPLSGAHIIRKGNHSPTTLYLGRNPHHPFDNYAKARLTFTSLQNQGLSNRITYHLVEVTSICRLIFSIVVLPRCDSCTRCNVIRKFSWYICKCLYKSSHYTRTKFTIFDPCVTYAQ